MEAIKALLFTSLTQIPSFLKQDVFIKDEEQKNLSTKSKAQTSHIM